MGWGVWWGGGYRARREKRAGVVRGGVGWGGWKNREHTERGRYVHVRGLREEEEEKRRVEVQSSINKSLGVWVCWVGAQTNIAAFSHF